jgi:phage terminase large subunit GpA-like protein
MMMAIDSGNWTHEVYAYVRRTRHPVMAVKGLSTGGKQIVHRFSEQDVRWNGRVIRNGVRLWPVGTDTAKNTLIGRLVADGEREADQRYFRFAEDTPEEFFDQLTAEKFDERRKRWVKTKGRRNEALDCLVYAYAAALHPHVALHKKRDADWTALEAVYEPAHVDLFSDAAARGTQASVPRETKSADPAHPLPPPPPPQASRVAPPMRRQW